MSGSLFGFDRLATTIGGGNPGLGRGAVARPSGRTHLADSATGRTACGRRSAGLAVSLVPADVDETTWPVRIALCSICRKVVDR